MLKAMALVSVLTCYLFLPCGQLGAEEPESTLEFRVADDNETPGWQKMEVRDSDRPIYVSDEVSLHGGHIEKVSFQKDEIGKPSIGITLTEEGGEAMKATTSQNLEKKLAILLDGEVIYAGTIKEAISSQVGISGNFDREDLLAFFHAIVLREMPSGK